MSDEKNPPSGFSWGLTPSDDPHDPKAERDAAEQDDHGSVDAAPSEEASSSPTAGLDLGYFLALNQTEMIAAATEGHDRVPEPERAPEPAAPAEPAAAPVAPVVSAEASRPAASAEPAVSTGPVLPSAPAEASAEASGATTDTEPNLPTVVDDDDEGEPTAAFDFRAPAPPPVDPIQAPVYHEGRALPWEQPPAFDASLDGATEVLGADSVGLDAPEDESAPTSAIDALFGEEKFEEYEDAPAQALVPFVSRDLVPAAAPKPSPAAAPKPPRAPLPKSQKVLVWVAGGLAVAVAIAGLFFIGMRIAPDAPEAAATPTAAPEPSAPAEAPAAPAAVLGPVAPGVHSWDDLLGTECVDPYANAWEKEYTVVDCAAPHGGQLVYRGRFDDSALDAYPGIDALQARMNLLCSSPENIDYAAASQFADIQVAASFAGTEDDWKSGNRNYFCFVSRSSGEPLTGSVSTPPRAPIAIPVAPAPEP